MPVERRYIIVLEVDVGAKTLSVEVIGLVEDEDVFGMMDTQTEISSFNRMWFQWFLVPSKQPNMRRNVLNNVTYEGQ